MERLGPVYLDHHSHVPLDPRVAAAMLDAFGRYDANPHSTHLPGLAAHRVVEEARLHVADLLGVEPAEILFTSGATEANNMAIRGWGPRSPGQQSVLVGAGEHPSILAPADEQGKAERVNLLRDGLVDLASLEAQLAGGDIGLVSVAAANHEIGTIQPVGRIGALAHAHRTLFHSDLAQAAGKIEIDLSEVDFASISSHKLGGPGGIGALFVRRRLRRHLRPLLHGGGQEAGSRPGTISAPLCVAFGEACRLAKAEMAAEAVRAGRLRDDLLRRLGGAGGMHVNGGEPRLPGNLNVSFDGVDGEALILHVRDRVAVSTGSACTSASVEPSHVLAAIGLSPQRAEGAVRFGLGRSTTAGDVADAADAVVAAVASLRATLRRVA